MSARFSERDLDRWVEQGILTAGQRDAILAELDTRPPDAGLNLTMLLYYGGGLLVLLAYSVFLGFQWEAMNGVGRLIISSLSLAFFGSVSYLLLRTDQSVVVKSGDGCQHNTHSYPIRNQSHNLLLTPYNRVGFTTNYPEPELLPIQIQCDIHPWMGARVHVQDHPWFAVTDAKGNFRIPDVPPGEYVVEALHETFDPVRGSVTVEAGKASGIALTLDG